MSQAFRTVLPPFDKLRCTTSTEQRAFMATSCAVAATSDTMLSSGLRYHPRESTRVTFTRAGSIASRR